MREVSVSRCTAFRLLKALDLHVQVHCRNVNSKLNVGTWIFFFTWFHNSYEIPGKFYINSYVPLVWENN